MKASSPELQAVSVPVLSLLPEARSFSQRPAPSFPRKGLLRHSREGLLRHSRKDLLRHSREGGNPQFPRMREFIVPLPQCPGKTHHHSRKGLLRYSRKGLLRHSRLRGNGTVFFSDIGVVGQWIPVFVGMT